MTIPTSILAKFISLWKEETGVSLSVNEAISKLRLISMSLDHDKRNHQAIRKDIGFTDFNSSQE